MQRLRESEGVPTYDRNTTHTIRTTARYPATKAIGQRLVEPLNSLREADDAVTKATRAQVEATADLQLCDAEDDDLVRELNQVIKLQERRDPTLALSSIVFPDGVDAVIGRSGAAQIRLLDLLIDRLEKNQARAPEIASKYLPKLKEAQVKTQAAVDAQKAAFHATAKARAEVDLAKLVIREETESVYADLRKLFRSAPKRAERFFTSSARTREFVPEDDTDKDEEGRDAA